MATLIEEKAEETPVGDPKDSVELLEEEEEETEETEEEEKEEEETLELDPKEFEQAKELISIFKDPGKFKQFIQKSAKDIGLIAEDTSRTEKAVARDYAKMLKESLGDEYGFLADRFLPVFNALIEDTTKTVTDRVTSVEIRHAKSELTAAYEKVLSEVPDWKANEDKIAAAVRKYPHDGSTSYKEYLLDMYTLATGNKVKGGSGTAASKVIKKIVKNANEAGKLASVGEDRVSPGGTLPTIKEAVAAAMRGKQL